MLDNFQEAECASLLAIVESAIEEAPAGVYLLVISREPPAKTLAKSVARGLLKSIAPESLRFSRDEVRLLTRGMDGESNLADVLHAESEGWASGITLMLETARSDGAASDALEFSARTLVFECFAAQVFSRLDATAQDILIQTSVLASMTAELTVQLTGRSEAAAVLSALYERKRSHTAAEGRGPPTSITSCFASSWPAARACSSETRVTGPSRRERQRFSMPNTPPNRRWPSPWKPKRGTSPLRLSSVTPMPWRLRATGTSC